jgi:hypothetical protein
MDDIERVEVEPPSDISAEDRQKEVDFLKSQSPEELRELFSQVRTIPCPNASARTGRGTATSRTRRRLRAAVHTYTSMYHPR